jgi:hypothetical protein
MRENEIDFSSMCEKIKRRELERKHQCGDNHEGINKNKNIKKSSKYE